MPECFDKLRFYLARFNRTREYYKEHHLAVVLRGFAFRDSRGAPLGYLEELYFHQGQLYLRGWTLASGLRIRLGEVTLWRSPNEEREDVASALACDRFVGFRANLPFEDGSLLLELEHEGSRLLFRHEIKIAQATRRAERLIMLCFWRDILLLLPTITRGLWCNDPDLPRRVKSALRLGQFDNNSSVLNRAFVAHPEMSNPVPALPHRISVIVPIHNALELLPETLGRIIKHTDIPFRLILIEDASTDPRLRPWLRDWVARNNGKNQIDLVENGHNLGFISSVNRGFKLTNADPGPVVLLNSDAMVPKGWASRLVAPLADCSVASATPLSNDAEIFSAPAICRRHELQAGQGDAIDAALCDRVCGHSPEVNVPTGVGFCMALHPDWLARVGGFDTIFGRGYGEEVDWCRRTAAQGARHVAVPRLFVEHRGGSSFGSDKLALVQQNNVIVSSRYSDYDQIVQAFIRNDPLITPRLMAALAWADSLPDLREIPVYIGHSMGGGAEKYLQRRVSADTVSVILRFGGTFRCRIEIDTPHGRIMANTDDLDLVLRLLTPISKRRLFYSCAVGDPNLAELPEFLLHLAHGAALEVLFHDYLPISPSYTLLDHDGIFRGVPDLENDDPAHCYRRPDGTVIKLAEWRTAWGHVIAAAECLRVFSNTSARIVMSAYPKAGERMEVTPHTLLQHIPHLPQSQTNERLVVGVLGAIGPQKGAAIVQELSKMVQHVDDVDLVLIGKLDPEFHLSSGTRNHGQYELADFPKLAQKYEINIWLIPSIWPETFSYTTHECLATGLPVIAFDIGAQGEAVSRAENGHAVSIDGQEGNPRQLAKAVLNTARAVVVAEQSQALDCSRDGM